MTLVYVVGFQPASDRAAVGGFDWYPVGDRDLAVERLVRHVTEQSEGDDHSLTFVPLEVPDGMGRDETTRWIEENLPLVEVGRDDAYRAASTEPRRAAPRVVYRDRLDILSIRVGRFLQRRGLVLGTVGGRVLDQPSESEGLAIFGRDAADAPPGRTFLWRRCRPRRPWLGNLWLENSFRDAVPDERWVFEVYGRGNVESAIVLADEMCLEFDVGVDLRLKSEEPRVEVRLCDYDF